MLVKNVVACPKTKRHEHTRTMCRLSSNFSLLSLRYIFCILFRVGEHLVLLSVLCCFFLDLAPRCSIRTLTPSCRESCRRLRGQVCLTRMALLGPSYPLLSREESRRKPHLVPTRAFSRDSQKRAPESLALFLERSGWRLGASGLLSHSKCGITECSPHACPLYFHRSELGQKKELSPLLRTTDYAGKVTSCTTLTKLKSCTQL